MSLAGAKNLAEAMELQATYWRQQLGELAAQAGEMRTLSTKVTADVAAPIKAQVTRGMKVLHKATWIHATAAQPKGPDLSPSALFAYGCPVA